MLVEDYAPFATSLKLALADRHDVGLAAGTEEAVGALTRSLFDAVLCDLRLEGRSGLELFERVKVASAEQARRFIFITGGALTDGDVLRLGAEGLPVIQKPFPLERLNALLEKLRASEEGE